MVRSWLILSLVATTSGCAFFADFDYEFTEDAAMVDGGADTGVDTGNDAGDDAGGGTCTSPCISDAVLDFSPEEQGVSPASWEYLSDDRDDVGFGYQPLLADQIDDAPAWSDGTRAPAIVSCASSSSGVCESASEGLVFIADPPGASRDPVLAFTAPADGTYELSTDIFSLAGTPEVILSRNGRLDSVATWSAALSMPTRVTGVLELLAGERGLFTVRPSSSDAVTLSAQARVLRSPGTPLEDCALALRFEEDAPPFMDGCRSRAARETSTSYETTATAGPDGSGAREFVGGSISNGSALMVGGTRFDYSGDLTVQVWVNVPRLGEQQIIYSDWSSGGSVGGVQLTYETRRPDTTDGRSVVAGFLFPAPPTPPSGPYVDCNDTRCIVRIAADLPSLGDWHFLRMIRDTTRDAVRLCVDGALVADGVVPGEADLSNAADVTIGAGGMPGSYLNGLLDDVRVFERALPCGP